MGASKIEVTSFEMSAPTHSISVDSDLSLMTVTIDGLSSAMYVSLDRPDGKHRKNENKNNFSRFK